MKVKLKYDYGMCDLCEDSGESSLQDKKRKFICIHLAGTANRVICFTCYKNLKKKVREARGY